MFEALTAKLEESQTSNEFPLIAEGSYLAQIVGITTTDNVENTFTGKIQDNMRIFYAVEFEGAPVVMSTFDIKVSLHEKAKLVSLLGEMFGKAYAKRAMADPSLVGSIVGMSTTVEIEHKANKEGTRTYANALEFVKTEDVKAFGEIEISGGYVGSPDAEYWHENVIVNRGDNSHVDADGDSVF